MSRARWRGSALLAVLLALTFMSALVVGGAYVTRQFAAASGMRNRGAGLEPLVEQALVRAAVTWDSASRSAQAVGATAELARTTDSRTETTTIALRLRGDLWWIVAESRSTAKPLLYRRLGVLMLASSGAVRPLPRRAWVELP